MPAWPPLIPRRLETSALSPSEHASSLLEMVGFNAMLGNRLVEWAPDRAVLEMLIRPEMLNRSHTLHGGVLATLIDAAGGFAGCHPGGANSSVVGPPRVALTISLTVNYLGRASSGVIRAVARRRNGGARIFVSTVDVFNADGELIAVGEAAYRLRTRPASPD